MISTEAEGVRVRCLGIPMPEPVPHGARDREGQSSDGLRGMGRESIVDRVDREK